MQTSKHPIALLCGFMTHDDTGAARTGVQIVRDMMGASFDINACNPQDPEGKNAIHTAIGCQGAMRIARGLLVQDFNADPHIKTARGGTLLHSFATAGADMNSDEAQDTYRWITKDLGISLGERNSDGKTAFDIANPNSASGRLLQSIRRQHEYNIDDLRADGFPLKKMMEGGFPKPDLMEAVEVGLLPKMLNPKDWKGGLHDLQIFMSGLPLQYQAEVDFTSKHRDMIRQSNTTASTLERVKSRRESRNDNPSPTRA